VGKATLKSNGNERSAMNLCKKGAAMKCFNDDSLYTSNVDEALKE
jgi:hypothetical protein